MNQFLLRLFFPQLSRDFHNLQLRFYIASEMLKSPNNLATVMPGDLNTNWDLVDYGGQNEGDRQSSPDPKQCPCGVDWACNNDSQILAARPAAAAIAALLAGIPDPALGSCDGECIAKETFRAECCQLWKHKTKAQFYLYGSKRVQWHCEIEG
jgi:hypothetical protein